MAGVHLQDEVKKNVAHPEMNLQYTLYEKEKLWRKKINEGDGAFLRKKLTFHFFASECSGERVKVDSTGEQ